MTKVALVEGWRAKESSTAMVGLFRFHLVTLPDSAKRRGAVPGLFKVIIPFLWERQTAFVDQ